MQESKLDNKLNIVSSNINILRFIMAIFVLFCHSFAITMNSEDWLFNATNGQCNLGGVAVAVFFFLSGLYISKSLDKEKNYVNFWKNRAKRILPQLWLTIILSLMFIGPVFTSLPIALYMKDKGTYLYLLNVLLVPVHNLPGVFEGAHYSTVNGSLWTLPVEVLCYFGLFLCMYIVKRIYTYQIRKVLTIIMVSGSLILSVGSYFIANIYIENNGFLATVIRPIIFFVIGVIYYELRDKIKLNLKLASVGLILLVVSVMTPVFNIVMFLVLPYVVLSYCLVTEQIMVNMPLFKISYEMYLIGWPIQQCLNMLSKYKMEAYTNFTLALVIDILLGYGIYKMTEKVTSKLF